MDGDCSLNGVSKDVKCGFMSDFTDYYLSKHIETLGVKKFIEHEEHEEYVEVRKYPYSYEQKIEELGRAAISLPSSFFVPIKIPLTLQVGSWLGVIMVWGLMIFHISTTPQLLDKILMVVASLVLTWIWIGICRWAKQESIKSR